MPFTVIQRLFVKGHTIFIWTKKIKIGTIEIKVHTKKLNEPKPPGTSHFFAKPAETTTKYIKDTETSHKFNKNSPVLNLARFGPKTAMKKMKNY